MTLTADAKKRVVIPGAAPGDVFKLERSGRRNSASDLSSRVA
jgi:hypothetical protein